MAEKVKLTDRKLQALKPAERDSATRSWTRTCLASACGSPTRASVPSSCSLDTPGSDNPTRRALGEYPTHSLAEAREKAREWRKWIAKGKDPKHEEERERLAELRKHAETFDLVVEKYTKRVLTKQRRGDVVHREIKTFFVERWKGRPISAIDRQDVLRDHQREQSIEAPPTKLTTYSATSAVSSTGRLQRATTDLSTLPATASGRRLRSVSESRGNAYSMTPNCESFWRSHREMGYPFGPLYRLLLLTGCRKSEIGEARRSELDTEKRLLVIPPERFKSDAQHLVPSQNALVDPSGLADLQQGRVFVQLFVRRKARERPYGRQGAAGRSS